MSRVRLELLNKIELLKNPEILQLIFDEYLQDINIIEDKEKREKTIEAVENFKEIISKANKKEISNYVEQLKIKAETLIFDINFYYALIVERLFAKENVNKNSEIMNKLNLDLSQKLLTYNNASIVGHNVSNTATIMQGAPDYDYYFALTLRQMSGILIESFLNYHYAIHPDGYFNFLKIIVTEFKEILKPSTIDLLNDWIENQVTIENGTKETNDKLPEIIEPEQEAGREETDTKNQPAIYNKKYLNIDEAVEYLNMAKATIYIYTSQKKIPHFKRGRNLFFKRDELDNWIEGGRRRTKAEIDQMAEDYLNSKKRR